MRNGLYWRLSLLIPPLAGVAILVSAAIAKWVFDAKPSESYAAYVLKVGSNLVIAGLVFWTWFAYAAWAGAYLFVTRRLKSARLRRTIWLAPITFGFVAAIATALRMWPGLGQFPESTLDLIGYASSVSVACGYGFVLLTFAGEWIGRRFGVIQQPIAG